MEFLSSSNSVEMATVSHAHEFKTVESVVVTVHWTLDIESVKKIFALQFKVRLLNWIIRSAGVVQCKIVDFRWKLLCYQQYFEYTTVQKEQENGINKSIYNGINSNMIYVCRTDTLRFQYACISISAEIRFTLNFAAAITIHDWVLWHLKIKCRIKSSIKGTISGCAHSVCERSCLFFSWIFRSENIRQQQHEQQHKKKTPSHQNVFKINTRFFRNHLSICGIICMGGTFSSDHKSR